MAEENGYFLDFIISPLAGILKAFGVAEETALKYTKMFVYGGFTIGVIVMGLRIYQFIRGK